MIQNLFAKRFSGRDKENMRDVTNHVNGQGGYPLYGRDPAVATPLFESPPVEKLAKSYTGYVNSGSINRAGQSVETRQDEQYRQEAIDGLKK